jgi:NhaP-type Na+/H+ or K+/H+ antiporter
VQFETGYLILGALLILVAAVSSFVRRLPLSDTMIYLLAGAALGPLGFGLLSLDARPHAGLLERLSEIAVIISLFTAGLKLRMPLRDRRWRIPVRLAFLSMSVTVGLVTLAGMYGLGLPLGAAVLLGAILAPTDPVLASGVQLADAHDRDRLRFSLTGEAGLNDGTAFPFVMLGLGLLGLHDIGPWGWRWWAIDVVWAIAAGLGIGAVCGTLVGRFVLYLRREHREGVGRDEFLALGLIAFSYGAAVSVHAYGFLAVFAAGLALRIIERHGTGNKPPAEIVAIEAAAQRDEIAEDPAHEPAHMAAAVLGFNEQMDRILEVALVLVVGIVFSPAYLNLEELWFVLALFFVIRPASVGIGLAGSKLRATEAGLIAWFGIRGIGSIYYLTYAVGRGLTPEISNRLIALTLIVIAVSITVHGITVTPLMAWYRGRKMRK